MGSAAEFGTPSGPRVVVSKHFGPGSQCKVLRTNTSMHFAKWYFIDSSVHRLLGDFIGTGPVLVVQDILVTTKTTAQLYDIEEFVVFISPTSRFHDLRVVGRLRFTNVLAL